MKAQSTAYRTPCPLAVHFQVLYVSHDILLADTTSSQLQRDCLDAWESTCIVDAICTPDCAQIAATQAGCDVKQFVLLATCECTLHAALLV